MESREEIDAIDAQYRGRNSNLYEPNINIDSRLQFNLYFSKW